MQKSIYSLELIGNVASKVDPRICAYHEANKGSCWKYGDSIMEQVKHVVDEDLDNTTDDEKLSKMYAEKKRLVRKNKANQYKRCLDMVKSKAWEHDRPEKYFWPSDIYNFREYDADTLAIIFNGKTFEQMQQEHLDVVQEWSANPSSLLIEYPGGESKTANQQYKTFRTDLLLNILTILKDTYNFNIESTTLAVMDDLVDKAVFSSTKEHIDQENGLLTVFTSEDGNRQTVFSFGKGAAGGGNRLMTLDGKDLGIVSYLLKTSMRNVSEDRPLLIEKKRIIREVMGDPKKRLYQSDYDDLDRRMLKLSNCTINAYEDGVLKTSCHFMDAFENKEIKNKQYISYYPSTYMKEQIEKNRVSRLPTEKRDRLNNSVAKLLYPMFTTQRVRAYRKMVSTGGQNEHFEIVFRYENFIQAVNFGCGNRNNNHREIIGALEEYRSLGIYIESYHYVSNTRSYVVRFLPLTDMEIMDMEIYFNDDDDDAPVNGCGSTVRQIDIFDFLTD